MRKVLDTNYLQSEELKKYLSGSKSNLVVLTDMLAMEIYKGDTLSSVFRSMEILSNFPKQVIVLKHTEDICWLSGHLEEFTKQMISEAAHDFSGFCNDLKMAKAGDDYRRKELLKRGRKATDYLNKMHSLTENIIPTYETFSQLFAKEEISKLRKDVVYSPELENKLADILHEAAIMMMIEVGVLDKRPDEIKQITNNEMRNMFLYRHNITVISACLYWIKKQSSNTGIQSKKILNNEVDNVIATYATYFDGVLSNDKKLHAIFNETKYWLRIISHNLSLGGLKS